MDSGSERKLSLPLLLTFIPGFSHFSTYDFLLSVFLQLLKCSNFFGEQETQDVSNAALAKNIPLTFLLIYVVLLLYGSKHLFKRSHRIGSTFRFTLHHHTTLAVKATDYIIIIFGDIGWYSVALLFGKFFFWTEV